jgi:hypothetical protein
LISIDDTNTTLCIVPKFHHKWTCQHGKGDSNKIVIFWEAIAKEGLALSSSSRGHQRTPQRMRAFQIVTSTLKKVNFTPFGPLGVQMLLISVDVAFHTLIRPPNSSSDFDNSSNQQEAVVTSPTFLPLQLKNNPQKSCFNRTKPTYVMHTTDQNTLKSSKSSKTPN